jgi:hypothetical protein
MKNEKITLTLVLAAGLSASAVLSQNPNLPPAKVAKIIANSCSVSGCHQGSTPSAGLNLEPDKILASTLGIASRQKPDFKLIDRDAPEKSYLLKKVRGDSDIAGRRMPRNRDALTSEALAALDAWIRGLKTDARMDFIAIGTF